MENFTYEGFDFMVEIKNDADHEAPWDDGDNNGIVFNRRGKKHPSERIIHNDGTNLTLYDWQGTIAKAEVEGWGLYPEAEQKLAQSLGHMPTKRQIVEAAVARDYEMMRSWCNNEWHYVGVVVRLPDEWGGREESVWGIPDNDTDVINEVRNELADSLITHISQFEREMRKASQTV